MCSKQGLLSFWNHCPYSHVSVPVDSPGMSFVTATALSEDKTRHYFSSANEVIFLFHVLFGATVSETSLDFFGMQRTVFLRLSVFSFFLELALRGRFSLIVLFQAFFVYFEPVSDAFFASSDLFQLKKVPQIIKNCSEAEEALL